MKKTITLIIAVITLAIAACGPSAEERFYMEIAKQDSIRAAQVADSIAAADSARIAETSSVQIQEFNLNDLPCGKIIGGHMETGAESGVIVMQGDNNRVYSVTVPGYVWASYEKGSRIGRCN